LDTLIEQSPCNSLTEQSHILKTFQINYYPLKNSQAVAALKAWVKKLGNQRWQRRMAAMMHGNANKLQLSLFHSLAVFEFLFWGLLWITLKFDIFTYPGIQLCRHNENRIVISGNIIS